MSDGAFVSGAHVEPVSFATLAGWDEADVAPAWRAFRRSAIAALDGTTALRPAVAPNNALIALCRRAAAKPDDLTPGAARAFFKRHCQPARVVLPENRPGFLTGYYQPIVDGSPVRTAAFKAPILARPSDLVTFAAGEHQASVTPGHSAGRIGRSGLMDDYPDRETIERAALAGEAEVLVWLRDWTEVFLIHVQGSACVRLADGAMLRLTYAGRNGHPYTSIGRLLIDAGEIAQDAMSLDALKLWLRSQGQDVGQPGRALMQRNRSYIFFRAEPITPQDAAIGPTGGAGIPLTARCSIAVDRSIWSYGLPIWIASETPVPGFGDAPLARLFVAQDTGSAILGPARADLFLGAGDCAGEAAGQVRHAADFTVLLPRNP